MNKMNKLLLVTAMTAVALAASVEPSFAAINVSPAIDTITTDGTTAITAVGTALIGLAGIAVVFKWVKGSIFG